MCYTFFNITSDFSDFGRWGGGGGDRGAVHGALPVRFEGAGAGGRRQAGAAVGEAGGRGRLEAAEAELGFDAAGGGG